MQHKRNNDDNTNQPINSYRVAEGGTLNSCPNAQTVNNNHYYANPIPRSYIITEIINSLSKLGEKLTPQKDIDINSFYIEKKIEHNHLDRWADEVKYYTAYSAHISRIYEEFDVQGKNKSMFVMRWLKNEYRKLSMITNGDQLFDELLQIADNAIWNDPQRSPNLMEEEISFELRIVLVDAFINCEIFEKPPMDTN